VFPLLGPERSQVLIEQERNTLKEMLCREQGLRADAEPTRDRNFVDRRRSIVDAHTQRERSSSSSVACSQGLRISVHHLSTAESPAERVVDRNACRCRRRLPTHGIGALPDKVVLWRALKRPVSSLKSAPGRSWRASLKEPRFVERSSHRHNVRTAAVPRLNSESTIPSHSSSLPVALPAVHVRPIVGT
jgi:hypothetical protein